LTHSLKAPGFFNPRAYKVKNWFQILLPNATRTATVRAVLAEARFAAHRGDAYLVEDAVPLKAPAAAAAAAP
jgi:hypothetical protein